MTATVQSSTEPMELLRTMLEERFAVHTRRLTEFTVYDRLPDRGGYDHDTLGMLAKAARQEIADTAQALQRMSQGTYGVCEGCHKDIPLRRLHTLPHARRCVLCERREPGLRNRPGDDQRMGLPPVTAMIAPEM